MFLRPSCAFWSLSVPGVVVLVAPGVPELEVAVLWSSFKVFFLLLKCRSSRVGVLAVLFCEVFPVFGEVSRSSGCIWRSIGYGKVKKVVRQSSRNPSNPDKFCNRL